MSTPQDSTAPVPILPSDPAYVADKTNAVRFSERVVAWLNGLSPSGVTEYDTGWVDIALTNGWTVDSDMTPQVRRVGRQVRIRGRVTGGTGAVTTLDAQFRPDAQHQSAIRDGSGNNVGIIIVAPNGAVTVGTATRPNIDTGWFTA